MIDKLLYDSNLDSVEVANGQYRYALRRGAPLRFAIHPAVFCMLNPSTATAEIDDPTIRRLKGFAALWKRDSIVVINLYASRTSSPKLLKYRFDPVGPDNDQIIDRVARSCREIIVAWGAHADEERAAEVANAMWRCGVTLSCLGQNKDGSPKHPLYLSADTKLRTYGFDKRTAAPAGPSVTEDHE